MLFRLLLTVSLFGVWSLPAFGCLGPSHKLDLLGCVYHELVPSLREFTMLYKADFDKATQQVSGGGTWYDSTGGEGIFSSQLSSLSKKVKECRRGLSGCYERAGLHRYSIELDDGRSKWFKWMASPPAVIIVDLSNSSGAIDMKFVRHADEGDSRTITIVDGDYTLTLVEGKIKSVPNSITYGNPHPRSNLRPEGKTYEELRKELLDLIKVLPQRRY